MKDQWVPQATRDAVVDYLAHWTQRIELPAKTLLGWLELAPSKFHHWKARYGRPNAHNASTPCDAWIAAWEQQAILDYHDQHPLEGYRRLTYMMLDGGGQDRIRTGCRTPEGDRCIRTQPMG